MSAAASRLELETPHDEGINPLDILETPGSTDTNEADEQHEREVLEKLTGITPPGSSSAIIAVDLDDVLCETNQAVAECKLLNRFVVLSHSIGFIRAQ